MFVAAVHVFVKPEAVDAFMELIQADQEGSLAEPGCVRFDMGTYLEEVAAADRKIGALGELLADAALIVANRTLGLRSDDSVAAPGIEAPRGQGPRHDRAREGRHFHRQGEASEHGHHL